MNRKLAHEIMEEYKSIKTASVSTIFEVDDRALADAVAAHYGIDRRAERLISFYVNKIKRASFEELVEDDKVSRIMGDLVRSGRAKIRRPFAQHVKKIFYDYEG